MMKWPYQWRVEKVGADPEVFFLDAKNQPVSVEGLLGGTKEEPRQMTGLPIGFMIQEDNVAAEYNIPPAEREKDFSNSIIRGLKYVEKQAKKHKLKVSFESAMHFPFEQLATPHAQRLGCEPDFNVWSKELNPAPIPPRTLRTAAGHVHVSWRNPLTESAILFGRAMDLYLGIPSLLVTRQNERRKLYGKAGAVRLKDYGVEYRVLDNYWLPNEKQSAFIFSTCFHIANKLNNMQSFLDEELEFYGDEIQHTINTHDIDGALRLMKHFDVSAFPEGNQHARE